MNGKSSFKIREGKTKKERTLYLNNLMADIVDYIETLPHETVYLFLSRKGEGYITTTQAYRIIVKAGDMIGNYYSGTHTIRKTFGYNFY